MELKLGAGQVVNSVMDLLIVPYGIETHEPGQHIYL